jgi:asparagine synthase (glutamine-hydrolysing)
MVAGQRYKPLIKDIKDKKSIAKRHIFRLDKHETMFNQKYRDDISRKDIINKLVEPYFNEHSLLRNLQYWDLKHWLPDDLLMKVDKTTMTYGLEARVPFLDHKLVEFTTKIPIRYQFSYMEDKGLLKKAYSDLLPSFIYKRKKKGFDLPIEKWFTTRYKDELLEIVETNRPIIKEFFDYNKVINNIQSNRNPIFTWRLVNYIMWKGNYEN